MEKDIPRLRARGRRLTMKDRGEAFTKTITGTIKSHKYDDGTLNITLEDGRLVLHRQTTSLVYYFLFKAGDKIGLQGRDVGAHIRAYDAGFALPEPKDAEQRYADAITKADEFQRAHPEYFVGGETE